MQRIFWDTNVLLDLVEKDSDDHFFAMYLHDMLCRKKTLMLCSPTTVCIAHYYFEKFYKQRKRIKVKLKELFSKFIITNENSAIVSAAFESQFDDLEEGIQYFSALDAKADVIITKNIFDYIMPEIEVLSPSLFIELYL